MNIKFLTGALVVCFSLITMRMEAQVNKKIRDSLSQLLLNHQASDTQRISLLNRYARISRHDSPDTAMQIVNKGLSLAYQLKSDRWKAQLLSTKAMIFSKMNLYDSCIYYGDSAAAMLKKLEMISAWLTTMNIIAENYSSKGDFSKSIDIFHKVIQTAQKAGNKADYGSAYGNIGSIYLGFGLYNEAITNYKHALTAFESINDSILTGSALTNLGLCYNGLMNYNTAEKYLERGLNIFTLLKRSDVLPDVKIALALVYTRSNDPGKALPLLTDALNAAKIAGNIFSVANAQIGLARAKKTLGDNTNKTIYYQEALHFAKAGLANAERIGENTLRSWGLDEISQIFFRLKEYQQAYHFRNEYISARDSITGANRRQEISIKEMEFKNAAQQELLLARHQAELDTQKNVKNLTVITSAFILMLASVLFLFYKRQRDTRIKQMEAELNAEIASIEMKALRSQMNPHFIFNCLNSIADYITKNQPQQARNYLTKFAKLMRMILEHSEQKEVSLAKDIEALEIYIQLESLRFTNKPGYDIDVSAEIDAENTFVPSLMLQPFVENCFKHGFNNIKEQGYIKIRILAEGQTLHCIVEDNGSGRKNSATAQPSYGTSLTQARINVINKQKNTGSSIKITDLSGGTRVELSLPY